MTWPFSRSPRKPDKAPDEPRTLPDALSLRVEACEARIRRLVDELSELEDGIARRFDKYRKRLERDDAPVTGEQPPERTRPASLPNGRVVPFDPLAVRRGRGMFPGGGK